MIDANFEGLGTGCRPIALANGLLVDGMTQERNTAAAQNKGARQLTVRFAHAPCVKLTLQQVSYIKPTAEGVRFLRLRKPETLIQIAA